MVTIYCVGRTPEKGTGKEALIRKVHLLRNVSENFVNVH
jgi:hypothetical protein